MADQVASADLFERAGRVIPGGVNSPVRSFRSVGGHPYFVARGEGAYVWDADGNRLLDFVQSYGASILGHAHPSVVAAIDRAASLGTTFGAPTEGEVLLAEAICRRVDGCDQVRLVSSGTEAAMSAVRVARGFTGRPRIVKFAGCYHGHSDGLLAGGGSGVATLGLPDSAGVPLAAVAETVVAPYNLVPELDEQVACVIVEAVAANMGLVPPEPGFLAGLRTACDRVGALLVFDEVITGFRLGEGGASAWSGVTPDLWCFGKVIGGGLPVGAFGGRADVLGVLAPEGPVYQAGTLSGNPLATAAGLAVLEELDADSYAALTERVGRFAGGLDEVLNAGLAKAGVVDGDGRGFEARVQRVGSLLGVFFLPEGTGAVHDYDGAASSAANGLYRGSSGPCWPGGWRSHRDPTRWRSPRWPTGTASWITPSMSPPRPSSTSERRREPWSGTAAHCLVTDETGASGALSHPPEALGPSTVPESRSLVFTGVEMVEGPAQVPAGHPGLSVVFSNRGFELIGEQPGEHHTVLWGNVHRARLEDRLDGATGETTTSFVAEASGVAIRLLLGEDRERSVVLDALEHCLGWWSPLVDPTSTTTASAPLPTAPAPTPPLRRNGRRRR